MSFNYTVPKTWLPTIYIIEIDDAIEGDDPAYLAAGFEPSGIDNLARLHNAKRTAYLQKFKGTLIVGQGAPVGQLGVVADVDTPVNALYFDVDTNAIWRPSVTGATITGWTNITKNVVMNLQEIQINDNGNDQNYASLKYNGVDKISLKNMVGTMIDMQVDTVAFDEIEGFSLLQIVTPDKELIINFGVTQESQNGNGKFSTKRFSAATGNPENDESLLWNQASDRWEFRRQLGDLSNLNIGNILVNSIKKTFAVYTLIQSQADFDLYFNTTVDGGVTSFTGAPLEPDYFYIKHGSYVLRNHLRINRSNFIIESGNGAVVTLDASIMKPASIHGFVIDIYPLAAGINQQINLSFYFEGQGLHQNNLVRFSRLKNANLKFSLRNMTIGKLFFYPTIGEMVIGPAASGDDEALVFHVAYQRGNRIWLVLDNVKMTETFHGLNKTLIRMVHDILPEPETEDQTLVYCHKVVIQGIQNSEATFVTTND